MEFGIIAPQSTKAWVNYKVVFHFSVLLSPSRPLMAVHLWYLWCVCGGLTCTHLPASVVVVSACIPLYCGVAWWVHFLPSFYSWHSGVPAGCQTLAAECLLLMTLGLLIWIGGCLLQQVAGRVAKAVDFRLRGGRLESQFRQRLLPLPPPPFPKCVSLVPVVCVECLVLWVNWLILIM